MFREGEEFASYAELRDKISEFERTEFIQLNVQRSKSIEASRRRAQTKNYNDDLRYSEIKLISYVYTEGRISKQLQKVNGLANGKHLCQ